MILRLAISVEHRLVIDKQIGRDKTMAYSVLAWSCPVKKRYAVIRGIAQHYISLPLGALSPS